MAWTASMWNHACREQLSVLGRRCRRIPLGEGTCTALALAPTPAPALAESSGGDAVNWAATSQETH